MTPDSEITASSAGLERLALRELDAEHHRYLVQLGAELRESGEPFLSDLQTATAENVAELVVTLRRAAEGLGLPPGFVPMLNYVADVDGTFIGIARLRLELTARLLEEGGHIGFYVRAKYRGRGFATCMLALALREAKLRGLQRLLVTCDSANQASRRVIEANGGRLEEEKQSGVSGHLIRRYWLEA